MSLGDAVDRARSILRDAIAEYRPVEVLAGFSGGHDSLVSTHFTLDLLMNAHALHANTGIGIEKTRRFVRETSRDRAWSLIERKTTESYEDMVLGKVFDDETGTELVYPGGFPGSPLHYIMYQRLKERSIFKAASEARSAYPKRRRGKRWVLIVTGIRGDESRVRTGYKRAVSVDKVNAIVWVNPFYWASADHFRAYRSAHELPVNPVCLALGFSGECLCGAHADAGELLRIRMVEPETADYLEDLQRKAHAAGFPWGYEEGPPKWFMDHKRGQKFFDFHHDGGPDYRPLCHNCEKVKAVPCNLAPGGTP
jgi:3'-phosphoadenosine 5'-phosphosulfate sulfotransferase (PAPS reductase)/FAD synthetase